MHKDTQKEFDKEFRPKDPINYSKSELAEPLFEAMNTLMNEVEAFINSHFTDNRVIEEKIEELRKNIGSHPYDGVAFSHKHVDEALQDLKQSLLGKSK